MQPFLHQKTHTTCFFQKFFKYNKGLFGYLNLISYIHPGVNRLEKKKKNFEPLESDVLMQQLNYLKMPRENAILHFAKEVKGCFEIF